MCDRNFRTYSARAVASYILAKLHAANVQDATNMKMQKLVYFAHGFMLGLKRHPLVDDPFEAWTYGPVCVSLYKALKRYGTEPVSGSISAPDQIEENSEAAGVIDQMLAMLANLTAFQLVNLSHDSGGPWDVIWSRNGKYAHIPNWLILDYFSKELAES